MKRMRGDVEAGELLVTHLNRRVVVPRVERGFHPEARPGAGVGNQIHDDLLTRQWASPPILADETEQAMFDLVPLARPWREWQT